MTEVVGVAVALVLVVSQLVVRLQVGALPQRFAISGTDDVAAVVRRRRVVARSVVGGVLAELVLHEEQLHLVVAGVAVAAVAAACLEADNDVTALGVQTAIELEHSPGVLVVSVGQAGTQIVVDGVGLKFGSEVSQWVGDVVVRVVVECCSERGVRGVVGAVAAVGSQEDIRQRVGLPFHADVSPPVVAAGIVRRAVVRERTRRLTVEVLAGILGLVVAVTMVPADACVNLQLVPVVVVQVGAEHFARVQSATVPPAGVLLLVVEVAQ